MSNLYKNNLFLIKNIKNNTYLSIDNNKLGLDNRFFSSYRQTYDIKDIVLAISASFIHYLNLIHISKELTYLPLLQDALLGFKIYLTTNIKNDNYDFINKYYLFVEKEINQIESIDKFAPTEDEENPNIIIKLRNFIIETVNYLLSFFYKSKNIN